MAKIWDRLILLITKMANKNFRIADFRSQATRISSRPMIVSLFWAPGGVSEQKKVIRYWQDGQGIGMGWPISMLSQRFEAAA